MCSSDLLQETSVVVNSTTSSFLVGVEGVCGKEDECGSSVDDTSGCAEDGSSAVVNALVDTPEFVGRRCVSDTGEGDGSSELRGVSSTEGKFTIRNGGRGSGFEGDTDFIGSYNFLFSQVRDMRVLKE